MKKIYINENSLMLLQEGDSRLKKVEKIIRQKFNGLLNVDGTVSGQEYYVNNNPETTWLQYITFHLRHDFGLMSNNDVKYLPKIAEIAIGELGFDTTEYNAEKGAILNKILLYVKSQAPTLDKQFTNPNANFETLYNEFNETLQQLEQNESERIKNKTYSSSDYEIVHVKDFDTANYYGNYSCSNSKLCYTQGYETWKQYTKNMTNKVYVCLKNGWKETEERPQENAPFDEYGLSMIFVFISPDGSLVYCNTRWNHANNDGSPVDHALTKEQISDIIQKPFNETFPPYTQEELDEFGGEWNYGNVEDAIKNGSFTIERLKNKGGRVFKLQNNIFIIGAYSYDNYDPSFRYTLLKDGKIILKWSDGYQKINDTNLYELFDRGYYSSNINYIINSNGDVIFTDLKRFYKTYASTNLCAYETYGGYWGMCDFNGNILLSHEEGYNNFENFGNGLVCLHHSSGQKDALINKEGVIILKQDNEDYGWILWDSDSLRSACQDTFIIYSKVEYTFKIMNTSGDIVLDDDILTEDVEDVLCLGENYVKIEYDKEVKLYNIAKHKFIFNDMNLRVNNRLIDNTFIRIRDRENKLINLINQKDTNEKLILPTWATREGIQSFYENNEYINFDIIKYQDIENIIHFVSTSGIEIGTAITQSTQILQKPTLIGSKETEYFFFAKMENEIPYLYLIDRNYKVMDIFKKLRIKANNIAWMSNMFAIVTDTFSFACFLKGSEFIIGMQNINNGVTDKESYREMTLSDYLNNMIFEGKSIFIPQNKLQLIKESQEELTFYSFFTQVKNFLKSLLTDLHSADVSETLKKYGLNKDILIQKLKKRGILKSQENITEVPIDESKIKNPLNKKLRAKYTVKYSVPRGDFEKNMHRLYTELFETEIKKNVFSNETEEIKKILNNDIDGAYKNRGGYKLSEISSKYIQNALINKFNEDEYEYPNDRDKRIRDIRYYAVDKYNDEHPSFHSGLSNKHRDDEWLQKYGKCQVKIFDSDYKTIEDLYNGVKSGRLLIHCREMQGIEDGFDRIYPEAGECVQDAYGAEYKEYNEEIPELIFASDNLNWANNTRNGVYFVESDKFQRSLGDGRVQFPNGEISNYYLNDIPLTVESGDWYTDEPVDVVGYMWIDKY